MAFVVFAGQSNIGGPFMNASTLSQPWTADPKTLMWDAGARAWVQMQPGANTGYGSLPNAWGPEVHFALAFRAAFPDEILRIVKSAEGGTTLEPDWTQWHYDWSPRSDTELFDRTAGMIRDAGAAAGGIRPDVVFWGQGETDGENVGSARAYGDNLTQLFAAIRTEWMTNPDGRIAFFRTNVTPPYSSDVRAGQARVDEADPHATSFDAGTYPTHGDGLHYSATGYDMIGGDFFRLFSGWRSSGEIAAGGGPTSPPPSGGGAGQDLNGTPAADTLMGGDGDDRMGGGDGRDFMRGGQGSDLMAGGGAFDDMHGNQGRDTLAGGEGDDWVVGGQDDDTLYGDEGDDIVYGNLGADLCDGGAGADLVRGGQGNDRLFGWSGNDWLSGDRGDDTVSGGSGADVFHGSADAGLDLITDFSVADGDRVQLDPGTTYAVRQDGADVVVEMSASRLVLQGVQLANLSGDWLFGA